MLTTYVFPTKLGNGGPNRTLLHRLRTEVVTNFAALKSMNLMNLRFEMPSHLFSLIYISHHMLVQFNPLLHLF